MDTYYTLLDIPAQATVEEVETAYRRQRERYSPERVAALGDEFRTVGIVVTIIAIVLAALSLVLDFGTIEAGVEAGAPKELEWYLGFGLMVTLIWLYISILKLLALLSRNR